MNTDIEPKAGSIGDSGRRNRRWELEVPSSGWILLVGPRSMNTMMLNAIARLGENDPVRILDGGNRFNAYTVSRAARGRPDVLNRITVSRAFTCYQVLALLESTPAIPVPFVVLDLLNTFYDESVQVGERKRLLQACIGHLERLSSSTRVADTADGGLIPPRQGAGGFSTTRFARQIVVETADGSWKLPRLVVSVHPPRVPSLASLELLDMLQSSTVDTYYIQTPAPAPEPLRLF